MLKYHTQAVRNDIDVFCLSFLFQRKSNTDLNNMFSQHCPNLLVLSGQTSSLMSAVPNLELQDGNSFRFYCVGLWFLIVTSEDKERLKYLLVCVMK